MDVTDLVNHLIGFFIGVFASITAHLIIVHSRGGGLWFYRMVWSPPWKRPLKPGIRGAHDLEQLIRLLGNIENWLRTKDIYLIDEVCKSLWKAIYILQVERFRYLAQFSQNEEERKSAIRELSLIDVDKTEEIVNTIISSQIESKRMKSFADRMLGKIDHLKESKDD